MDKPMISIVIPVYNGANYVREAIDSALAQTYENKEVIVVNDGSNDQGETERAVLSYGDRIRYFRKENGGVATALNLAIREMRGEYFSWLSHDDLYYPHKLERQMDALVAEGDMHAVVYCDFDHLDMGSGIKTHGNLNGRYTAEQLSNGAFVIVHDCAYGCALLIHRSHFSRVGLFNETLRAAQDNDMWLRMFRHQKLVYVPESLACRRLHPRQGIKTIPNAHIEGGHFLFEAATSFTEEEIKEAFGHPGIFYHYVAGGIRARGVPQLYEKAAALYQTACEKKVGMQDLEAFASWFETLRSDCRQVCIFGTGISGKQLLFDLEGRGVKVDFFASNSKKRWGTLVEGHRCISPEELKEICAHTLIVVAVQEADTIQAQLRDMQCPHVITKRMLDGPISCTIPIQL